MTCARSLRSRGIAPRPVLDHHRPMGRDRQQRKEAKRRRKTMRRAEVAAQRGRQGVPVFFAERTGRVFHRRGFWCDREGCKHITRVDSPTPDWPDPTPSLACEKCGTPAEMRSISHDEEFRRADTGEVLGIRPNLPPGAVFEALGHDDEPPHNWRSRKDGIIHHPGPDGRVLICILPDGHPWTIDSRCNNCTLPEDDKHWCWNRTGSPEDGTLDVRKGKPGQTTCAAGGGSVDDGTWHGFLHDGKLVSC